MKYKGLTVGLDNYKDLFSTYSIDVQDEVRSAVLDGVDLEPYVDRYSEDPIKLHQIRLSVKEGISESFFFIPGVVLYEVRKALQKGLNIQSLMQYTGVQFTQEQWGYLIRWLQKGYNIEKYKFNEVNGDLWIIYDKGISLELPMHKFNTGVNYSKEYLTKMVRLLSKGAKVDKYLNGDWSLDVLEQLEKHVGKPYYRQVDKYLTCKSSSQWVESLMYCARKGMPLNEIGASRGDDFPLYQPFQLDWLAQAYEEGLEWEKMLDPSIGNGELSSMYQEIKNDSQRTYFRRFSRR